MSSERTAPAKDAGEQIPVQQRACINDNNRSQSPKWNHNEFSLGASSSLPVPTESIPTTSSCSNPSLSSCHDDTNSDAFSDSSNSIPSSERPTAWRVPYVSVSRLIRGPQQQQQQETPVAIPSGSEESDHHHREEQQQRSRSSSSESASSLSVSHTDMDNSVMINNVGHMDEKEHSETNHNSNIPLSLEDNSHDSGSSSVFLVHAGYGDIEDHLVHAGYGDIEDQYPMTIMEEPVPFTFQERRARIWSYASSSATSSRAVGNLMNDESHTTTTHDDNHYPQPFLHDIDSECSSNASSSSDESDGGGRAIITRPFEHFFYDSSSILYNNTTMSHQHQELEQRQKLERQQRMMMVTRSILFPSTAGKDRGDRQRSFATYMFSFLVGGVVLAMFGLYALVATSNLVAK